MRPNWTFDTRTNTHVFGTTNDGGGVFNDGEGWEGNVVVGGDVVVGFGPFASEQVAKGEIEAEYSKMKERHNGD